MKAKRVNYTGGELYGYKIICPGCDDPHVLPVGDAGDNLKHDRWTFNGDIERPVFNPSLLCRWETATPPVTPENLEQWRQKPWEQTKVKHVCHSFIGCNGAQPGQIIYLDDCTHAMRGQVVDLPDIPVREDDES